MTIMWEARAAEGKADELVAFVVADADPSAQIYRSDRGESRVVVIDPTGRGIENVPPELLARPAHAWVFEPVTRDDSVDGVN